MKCLICDRIEKIKQNANPYFVKELNTGYVVLGDHQLFRGYTLFLCKEHKKELHELGPAFRNEFLSEMSIVAEAVYCAFQPHKLNYELLGNVDSHMHWHIFPRYINDMLPNSVVWLVDKKIRNSINNIPTEKQLLEMKSRLSKKIEEKYYG